MAFSASFSSITETSARFRASFTGGDSGFSYYRYVRLDIDRDTYEIRSDSVGGALGDWTLELLMTGKHSLDMRMRQGPLHG